MTTLNTIIEEEKKKFENTAGYNYNLYLAGTVRRADTDEDWTFEQAGKELKDFLTIAMQRVAKTEREHWLRSEIEKLEVAKSEHCGKKDCAQGQCANRATRNQALTSIITRYKEELLELEK